MFVVLMYFFFCKLVYEHCRGDFSNYLEELTKQKAEDGSWGLSMWISFKFAINKTITSQKNLGQPSEGL